MNNRQSIQLFRNATMYSSYADAVSGLSTGLSYAVDGEILISRYKVDDDYKVVLGVVTVDGENKSINIVDEVSKVLEKVLDGANVITSFKDVETVVTNLLGTIKEGQNDWNEQAAEFKAAVEALQEAVGEGGSVSQQIQTAIENLDKTDDAVVGQLVKSVSQEDGVITVVRDFLAETDIKLQKNTDSLEPNVLEEFTLVNGSGITLGDTIKIYKDKNLKDVKFQDQKLIFTYILSTGEENEVEVDVSAFLSEEEFSNGLQVVDHVVSVKSANEKHIVVSKDGVGLGENAVVYSDFTWNGIDRKTIQLANYDSISAKGANCLEGQTNGYPGGEDLSGESFNLAMVSIWNVADFGSSRIHMNLNSKEVDGRPAITVNDEEVVAYVSDLQNASKDMLGIPEGKTEEDLSFKSIWDLDQEVKRLEENKAQRFEINAKEDSNITVESSVEEKDGVQTTIFNIGLNGIEGGTW